MSRARRWVSLLCFGSLGCNAGDIVLYVPREAGIAAGGSSASDAASDAEDGSSGDSGLLGGEAGGPSDGATPCYSNADCPETLFCSKASCGAELGSCARKPYICDVNASPVCGCDHINYWNDCLRQDYGISASRPGECNPNGKTCMIDGDCEVTGVTCAHLLPSQSGCYPAPGRCWATPNSCTAASDSRHWLVCPLLPQDSAPVCVPTCDAIQSGATYIQAPRGVECE